MSMEIVIYCTVCFIRYSLLLAKIRVLSVNLLFSHIYFMLSCSECYTSIVFEDFNFLAVQVIFIFVYITNYLHFITIFKFLTP